MNVGRTESLTIHPTIVFSHKLVLLGLVNSPGFANVFPTQSPVAKYHGVSLEPSADVGKFRECTSLHQAINFHLPPILPLISTHNFLCKSLFKLQT